MDWQTGSKIIQTMLASDLCAYLVMGDIMNEMFDDLTREQKLNKKKNPSLWRDLGGANWRKGAWGQLALLTGKGSAQTHAIARVSSIFTADILPRDPEQNTFDKPWTWLRYCAHRDDPLKAYRWGIEHDASLFEIAHIKEDGDGYVVSSKKVGLEHGGMVNCPQCGALYKVVRSKRNEVEGIEEADEGQIVDADEPTRGRDAG